MDLASIRGAPPLVSYDRSFHISVESAPVQIYIGSITNLGYYSHARNRAPTFLGPKLCAHQKERHPESRR